MPDLEWTDSTLPEGAGAAFVLWQCEDCAAGRIEGRTFTLSIDEGVAGLGCPVPECSGLDIDSEMLQLDDVDVTITLEKSGGTYEYPNDCNYWYDVRLKEKKDGADS